MIKLCKDCFHCKLKSDKKNVICYLKYFNQIPLSDLKLCTPSDFECLEWDSGN